MPNIWWETVTLSQEGYDRFKRLGKKGKAVVYAILALLVAAVFTNPSYENYKDELPGILYEELDAKNQKKLFFNKVLYDSVVKETQNNAEGIYLILFSLYSSEAALYDPSRPDLETSSIGFMGKFWSTSLKATPTLMESLRPERPDGR